MKIVNRGFVKVSAQQPFVDWANSADEEFVAELGAEPNIYLIEEDFFDVEPVIKANFKKIFVNELEMVSEDVDSYPEIRLEVFLEWFSIEVGNAVFDCKDQGLNRE